jgi:hypothetical protein
MDVALAGLVSGAAVQFLDVPTQQGVFDIACNRGAVFVRDEPGGMGFGQFSKVWPNGEQLIEDGGLFVPGQGRKCGRWTARL